ncbi:MAG: hypothetical protein WCQ54_14315 [Clostridiaceae bacterium]
MKLKLFKHIKNKILKKKQDMVYNVAYILNGVLVHSVNFGSGFYIRNLNTDSDKKSGS